MTDSNEKFKVKLKQPHQEQPQNIPEGAIGDSGQSPSADVQMTEMDLLYQEALNALEDVESDLNITSDILLEEVDPDEESNEKEFEEISVEQQESISSETIVLKLHKSDNGVTPEMIVEGLLFVGGKPLTTKKLCQILGGTADADLMQKLIDGLNHTYGTQNRPYSIQFGEGGYRLVLKTEYEKVQNKVFGLGPKEIKLSQEVLEILALVAYEQPISKKEIDKLTKKSTNAILRQLVRRELIEIERNDSNRKNVSYKTSERFLRVFGIADLSELPQSEMIEFK